MKPVTLVGVVLILLGVLALTDQGITYTAREQVVDLGPLTASVDAVERRSVMRSWRHVVPNRDDARGGAIVTS